MKRKLYIWKWMAIFFRESLRIKWDDDTEARKWNELGLTIEYRWIRCEIGLIPLKKWPKWRVVFTDSVVESVIHRLFSFLFIRQKHGPRGAFPSMRWRFQTSLGGTKNVMEWMIMICRLCQSKYDSVQERQDFIAIQKQRLLQSRGRTEFDSIMAKKWQIFFGDMIKQGWDRVGIRMTMSIWILSSTTFWEKPANDLLLSQSNDDIEFRRVDIWLLYCLLWLLRLKLNFWPLGFINQSLTNRTTKATFSQYFLLIS
jgi:hypothetical protein